MFFKKNIYEVKNRDKLEMKYIIKLTERSLFGKFLWLLKKKIPTPLFSTIGKWAKSVEPVRNLDRYRLTSIKFKKIKIESNKSFRKDYKKF